jgi:hydrogenase-4 component B
MSELLVLGAIGLAAASGLAGLPFGRAAMSGQWLTTVVAVLGAVLGLAGVGDFCIAGASEPVLLPWAIAGAEFSVAVDALSAIFLLPVFLIALLGNIYGLAYWPQTEHPRTGNKLRFFYGTLTAGMALLLIARTSILFLMGWEVMALSAFFLVATEDHDSQVRDAAWIYLAATHLATLCLIALFALLHAANGSFALVAPDPERLTPAMATAILVLALLGFGLKAGIMPLHVWLPGAHAMAPSHVSAMMSGVLIKMGIYGLVRVTGLLPEPPLAWGAAGAGAGRDFGRSRRGLRHRPARSQALTRLPQHREYRHHRHGPRPCPARSFLEPR